MIGNVRSQHQVQYDVGAVCRSATNIVVALSGSIALYVIIGLVILRTRPGSIGPVPGRIPLYVIALFLALASPAYRRTQLRWLRLESVASVKGISGLVKHLYATTLVSAALGEMIGLLGLALLVLGGNIEDLLSLGIVGLVTILVSFPRRRAWLQTVEYLDVEDEDGGEEPNAKGAALD
ncbi:MAG: hypothetical protein ACREDR_06840 [Blastocatellia bacterium]